ncbi:MAG TPA: ArgE/DapE family deacylase [Gemmatimonadaceae bacterium]|nr:ArgE/DapE family deacylase [Gemmatimonadaceae bacterium]
MSESPSDRGDAAGARVDDAVDALATELAEFARSLVRIPSVSGNEQAAQRAMAAMYESLGLETDVIASSREEIESHPAFSDDAIPFVDRLNVIGSWRGRGGGRSLIVNGHMDVVPPGDLAKWTRDPWGGEIEGDRLYGRGACDMKSGLASAVFAVRALKSIGIELRGDVMLQSVIGEETGGVGSLTTIVRGYRADACIIAEPMDLRIAPVQTGALTFRLTVHGRGAHACMKPHGVSAITESLPIMAALEQLNTDRHRRFRDELFDDPQNIASLSVGTVRAGDWPSTVPDMLVAEGRLGVFPNESTDEARAALVAAVSDVAAASPWLVEHPPVIEWVEGQFEPGATPLDAPILERLACSHEAVVGVPPSIFGVPCGTDLRLFTRHANIPTVLYGPGNVVHAHAADEFVLLSQVVTCTKVLARTMLAWCGT